MCGRVRWWCCGGVRRRAEVYVRCGTGAIAIAKKMASKHALEARLGEAKGKLPCVKWRAGVHSSALMRVLFLYIILDVTLCFMVLSVCLLSAHLCVCLLFYLLSKCLICLPACCLPIAAALSRASLSLPLRFLLRPICSRSLFSVYIIAQSRTQNMPSRRLRHDVMYRLPPPR